MEKINEYDNLDIGDFIEVLIAIPLALYCFTYTNSIRV